MKPELNSDYELIYIDKDQDKMFFKNKFYKNLVSLSSAEFDIIQFYLENPDYETTFQHYSRQYELNREFVPLLIKKAEEAGLLMSEGYEQKKRYLAAKSGKRQSNGILLYITNYLRIFLKWFGIKSQIEMQGDFYYFGLLSFPLEKTWLEKICLKRFVQISLIVLYFLILAASVYVLKDFNSQGKGWNDLYIVMFGNILLCFVAIILLSFILSFLHEMGHFLLYKRFGGITSEMGMALMTGIILIISVTTNSLYLWKSRSKRLLVTLGGILVDLLFFMISLSILHLSNSRILSFYSLFFSFYLGYRVFYNINPFIPRTDGYFIMCDFMSQPFFYKTAYNNYKSVMKKIKTLHISEISRIEIYHTIYYLFSFLFITINYTVLSLPLFFWIIYLIINYF